MFKCDDFIFMHVHGTNIYIPLHACPPFRYWDTKAMDKPVDEVVLVAGDDLVLGGSCMEYNPEVLHWYICVRI